jgi:mono/diheme cytochrome c family protein
MRLRAATAFLLLAGLLVPSAVQWWRGKNIGPVQRGWRVAEARGCFACHGPGGREIEGAAGEAVGAPPFSPEAMSSYATNEAEIHEWILDGMPRRLRNRPRPLDIEAMPFIKMPAWRGILSQREVDDLVAYLKAVSDFETPGEEKAEAGRQAALRMGCFSCHGPQGRGNPANPRSLKGYIPSWDGPDFPDLVQSDAEIREWILDGSPKRLRENSFARWFLEHQVLQMPAYRGRITEQELHTIMDYIRSWTTSIGSGETPRPLESGIALQLGGPHVAS